MKVYRDILSGDEMLSDAFPIKDVIDKDGNKIEGLICAESKLIVKNSEDIDVGCGNEFGSGGENEDGPLENTAQKVNNIIDGFQYTETQVGSASDFKSWIKEYFNAVVLKLREKGKPKEEIQAFKALAPEIAKFFLKNFADLQFYLGPSFDSSTMVFSIYAEGAETPTFYYILGGYDVEKF